MCAVCVGKELQPQCHRKKAGAHLQVKKREHALIAQEVRRPQAPKLNTVGLQQWLLKSPPPSAAHIEPERQNAATSSTSNAGSSSTSNRRVVHQYDWEADHSSVSGWMVRVARCQKGCRVGEKAEGDGELWLDVEEESGSTTQAFFSVACVHRWYQATHGIDHGSSYNLLVAFA
uniref:Uncharacterized protein n=1 Tax=Eutreptiella gymnastica TaxID=73025 RepID=A0A7S4C8F9_9EUGL